MKKFVLINIIFILFGLKKVTGQTCGFGCLGLSGFYGGYSVQRYEADGLNNYIKGIYNNSNVKFGEGRGFRIGANIFRANYSNFFFTAKGFYQFLKEEKSIPTDNPSYDENSFALELNHWGVGCDFGIPVFNFLDWKIIDGGVKFYLSNLKDKKTKNLAAVQENNYKSDKLNIGYFIGTGLIIHLFNKYLSIEGAASYNFFEVDALKDGNNQIPLPMNKEKLISKGAIEATVQLNLGIPL